MAKRASYRAGVEIIALNDESAELDVEVMAEVFSVGLLADVFGKNAHEVAEDVVRWRKKNPGA